MKKLCTCLDGKQRKEGYYPIVWFHRDDLVGMIPKAKLTKIPESEIERISYRMQNALSGGDDYFFNLEEAVKVVLSITDEEMRKLRAKADEEEDD